MGQSIEFTRPDGQTCPGYLATPAGGGADAPGVVVVEEWWGVTPQITQVADDLAARGYRALVPDLYRGRTAAVGDEANHLMQGLDFGDAATQDVRGAVLELKKNGRKVAVLGFCMGGAIAVLAGMYVAEADAVVAFYGFPPPEAGDPGTIRVPVLAHAGRKDQFWKPDAVEVFEEKLRAGGVTYELHWYDADHGFTNPAPVGQAGLGHYDEAAANQAWERTYAFLDRVLKR
ncbi:MAG TPA: dienelactone hydrolase family protein [Candidatus Elarobacter sp.]|jgi:carboxymethylenebutenolidase|nr:dienelactone hydrolase family protein [Candidatus Elarobacter sp.]